MKSVWLTTFLQWLLHERSDLLKDCVAHLKHLHAEKTPQELSEHLTFCEPQCRYYQQISGDQIQDLPGLSDGMKSAAFSASAASAILRSSLVAAQHQLLLPDLVPDDPTLRADLVLRQLSHALRTNQGIPLPEHHMPRGDNWPRLFPENRDDLARDYLNWWATAENPGRAGFHFGYMLYRPVFRTLVFLHLKSVGQVSLALLSDGRLDPYEDHHLRDQHKHATRVVLETLLALAYADGIVQQEELRLFYEYGKSLGMESGYSLREFNSEQIDDLKNLIQSPAERECLLACLTGIARADLLLHPLEQEFLTRVCMALRVPIPI